MTDLFNPIDSSFGNFDDDFTMTDPSLRELLPKHSRENFDELWDQMTLPSPADVGNSFFSTSTHNEITSTHSTLTPCPTFSETDMDPCLTPSLMSLQPCANTSASERATPRQTSSMSTLPRVQRSNTLPSSDGFPSRCQCLRLIEVLLKDLERKNYLDDLAALDSTLAWQKRALAHCSTVLSCSACVARSEYILLLGLITDKLATLCESTVSLYLKEVQRRTTSRTNSDCGHHSRTSSEESSTIFLGCYEIESREEWSSLIRVLIVLQLRNLRSLLGDMNKAATTRTNASHLPMVQATERRLGNLIQKLRDPGPQHH